MWISKLLLITLYLFLPYGLIKSYYANDFEASSLAELYKNNNYKDKISNLLDCEMKNSQFLEPVGNEVGEPIIPKAALLGKTNPAGSDYFALIPTTMASSSTMYLRVEAKEALVSMYKAALADGVNIKVISAFRSFDHQKRIWEDKWQGKAARFKQYSEIGDYLMRCKAIMQYSAMPGTSRHHWGTDIDINSLSNSYFEIGAGKKLYNWMQENASKFGFCEPYSEKGVLRETGYEAEKWHWSYQPLACQFLDQFVDQISYSDISGFAGAEKAEALSAIEDYVLGISTRCN